MSLSMNFVSFIVFIHMCSAT